jgi:hypothetical protein
MNPANERPAPIEFSIAKSWSDTLQDEPAAPDLASIGEWLRMLDRAMTHAERTAAT